MSNPVPSSDNPALAALGYRPTDRLVIFHADDLGMTEGSLHAFWDLQEAGIVRSGSIMVPCAWAADMLAYGALYPELDLGIHLTGVCEWPAERWGPILDRWYVPDLCMADGAFWPDQPTACQQVQNRSLQRESIAQLLYARDRGLNFTHIDAHAVGGVFRDLTLFYVALGFHFQVPVLFPRQMSPFLRAHVPTPGMPQLWTTITRIIEAAGMPLVDNLRTTLFRPDQPGWCPPDLAAAYEQDIACIPPGITYYALHPNTPEHTGRIRPDALVFRTFEHAYFQSARAREFLDAQGIVPIGMRELHAIMKHKVNESTNRKSLLSDRLFRRQERRHK